MQEQLGILGTRHGVLMAPFDWARGVSPEPEVFLSEGSAIAELIGPWKELPSRTPLYGELYFGNERVYGRFTRTRLPTGELVPICMETVSRFR